MGILNNGIGAVASAGLRAVGLPGFGALNPNGFKADFDEGFRIEEIENGRPVPEKAIQLVGSFMPMIPFKFGGTQQTVKEYYPGNKEPTIQILGARESNVVINGRLKTKRFKDESLYLAASEYQESIDAMRMRGNVVKITLGEWKRYAIIEECTFNLKRLCDIEYEITFSIIGLTPPKNCKFNDNDIGIDQPNADLTNRAAIALAEMQNYPDSMPLSVSDIIDNAVSAVASAVNLVTGFVDGVISDVEAIERSANRALGLIKNARATISAYQRRVGAILFTAEQLGSAFSKQSLKASAQINSTNHIRKVMAGFADMKAALAALQAKYAKLSLTVAFKRHLVKDGDTLQTVSIQYYNDVNNWKVIYDHNKLTSTELVEGTVLEIPKV